MIFNDLISDPQFSEESVVDPKGLSTFLDTIWDPKSSDPTALTDEKETFTLTVT